jgi:hypothetical protein
VAGRRRRLGRRLVGAAAAGPPGQLSRRARFPAPAKRVRRSSRSSVVNRS